MILRNKTAVEEYDTNGKYVGSFELGIKSSAQDVTVANDGLLMVVQLGDPCVHIFSESGDYIDKFKLQQIDYNYTSISFHRAGEQVVVASTQEGKPPQVEIYSKDGEFVHFAQIPFDDGIYFVKGIMFTTEGRIACVINWNKAFIF